MQNKIRLFTLAAVLATCASSFAGTSFWFASPFDATGVPLSSLTVGAVGSTFDVSVWFSSDVELSALETLVAFDRSSSDGVGASPMDGKLSLSGTATTGMTGLGSGLSILGNPSLAGGTLAAGSGARGYGLDAPIIGTGFSSIAATTGRQLLTVKLKNTGIAPGGSYALSFHSADDTVSQYATFGIDDSGNVLIPKTTGLTVRTQAVPEPAPLLALAGGLAALVRRRRK